MWLKGRNELNERKANTMKSMQKLELTALALTLGALIAASPVLAGWGPRNIKNESPENFGTIQLTNAGEEPAASGEATLRHVVCSYVRVVGGSWGDPIVERGYTGTLIVKCQNLIPGATYSTPVGTFTADSKGTGTITGGVAWGTTGYSFEGFGGYVEVVRLDGDGSSTTVLEGGFCLWAE
jgi:hypothetical protein